MSEHPEPVTLESLDARMSRIETRLEGLATAWETGVGVAKFIKWAAGIGAAVVTFYLAVKHLIVGDLA